MADDEIMQNNTQNVRVRMAPSPTGNLNLGTVYTTLFNYLFAKRHRGTFLLRIEDTDRARSTKEFEENILNGLIWLGLKWDEGPYHQVDRLPDYQKAADQLLAEDKAYYCFCIPEELEEERKLQQSKGLPQVYSGKCRKLSSLEAEKLKSEGKNFTIRFKMPEKRGLITFHDFIHGDVSIDSSLIKDFVIMRSNGIPLYNFAVVVDDIDMKITHVLRGDDHISNTPKQIVLFEALGEKLPHFAHWPIILNPNRIGKLSKRKGATSIDEFKGMGFLPEAIVNYLSLLGWTFPEDREVMSLDEMEQTFDLDLIRKSPAAFNIDKLIWLNGEYIRKMSDDELFQRLMNFLGDHLDKGKVSKLVPLTKERIKKLEDFLPLTNFVFEKPGYDPAVFKELKLENVDVKEILAQIVEVMQLWSKPWIKEKFESELQALAAKFKLSNRDFFQLLRFAVSGQLITPPLFESIEILGEDETIQRVLWVKHNYQNI